MDGSNCCRALAASLAIAAAASCASIDTGDITLRPRVGRGEPGLRDAPGTSFPRPDSSGVIDGSRSNLVRRVCRSSGWPRDWIATAYEDAPGECPLGPGTDSVAVAAVIVALDHQPLGALIDVCADQPVPARWAREDDERDEMVQRCPGAGRDGASAMMRIRRIR